MTDTIDKQSMDKDEFRTEAIARIEELVKARTNNGSLESECDLLAGAMCIMAIVNVMSFGATEDESMGLVSPKWVFYPMRGQSILDDKVE